jgi:hypothetical protein
MPEGTAMKRALQLDILPQPDDTTCGPTCLHAVYRYWGDEIPLAQVIATTRRLSTGGTLGVNLANHALERGYRATVYTYNLQVFDPTWFDPGVPDMRARIERQLEFKKSRRLHTAAHAYLRFLDHGGELRFADLSEALLHRYLRRSIPILTGLSATFLYREPREHGEDNRPDDLRGEPVGHFVVLCGYDKGKRKVRIADPLESNPVSPSQLYEVDTDRLISAILLGTLTYDANLLILEPR